MKKIGQLGLGHHFQFQWIVQLLRLEEKIFVHAFISLFSAIHTIIIGGSIDLFWGCPYGFYRFFSIENLICAVRLSRFLKPYSIDL